MREGKERERCGNGREKKRNDKENKQRGRAIEEGAGLDKELGIE